MAYRRMARSSGRRSDWARGTFDGIVAAGGTGTKINLLGEYETAKGMTATDGATAVRIHATLTFNPDPATPAGESRLFCGIVVASPADLPQPVTERHERDWIYWDRRCMNFQVYTSGGNPVQYYWIIDLASKRKINDLEELTMVLQQGAGFNAADVNLNWSVLILL